MKMLTKAGKPTAYALHCGYIERHDACYIFGLSSGAYAVNCDNGGPIMYFHNLAKARAWARGYVCNAAV